MLFVYCGEHLVLAFRGSNQPLDWRYNLRFGPRRWRALPGRWHHGFTEGADRLRPVLEYVVRAHEGTVWLVGHSLGGALAGATAALLAARQLDWKVGGVLQLGSPRFTTVTGSRWLSERYRDRWFRVALPADRVPHLPTALLGYRHVGSEIKPPTRTVRRWRYYFPGGFLGNHRITRYVAALEQCVSADCIGPEGLRAGREFSPVPCP